jgi:subtilisin family serine protease
VQIRRAALAAVLACGMTATGLATTTQATAAPLAGNRAYFVITAPNDTTGAKNAIPGNGGTVFASYDAIGVIVAHSESTTFAGAMRGVTGVQKVGATRTSDVPAAAANPAIPPAPSQQTPAAGEPVRADMSQIGADRAWDISTGSPNVTVGVLDTGVDDQHFDLRDNFVASKSASCAYGRLDTRAGSWRPNNSHGTHVAGTIAAGRNGRGMVGVAPSVKIASVRIAEDPSGLFFPENTVCAFMFAGDQNFDVTNNSYFTDPWLYLCPSNVDQDAILEGVRRAVAYSEGRGVLNVAAAGNENANLANKTSDSISPNDSTPVTRPVNNTCLTVPGELPGMVTVAALTSGNAKASFSNFGTNKISTSAPGVSTFSTLPGGTYGSLSGTSMASPHVAGVAALLASVNPTDTPAALRTKIAQQSDDLMCPASDSRCTGTAAINSFFGEGRVDAFEAVQGTIPPGQFFQNTNNVNIPDNSPAVTSPITVSGVAGNAPATLRVGVDIKHTFRGDLIVDLIAPDGSVYNLHNRTGGSADNLITAFTVNASSEVANGTWLLRVRDAAAIDVGFIDAWNLTF